MAGDFSLDYSADFYIQSPPPPPAPEPNGLFPPFGPTTVTATVNAYLYQEYTDDDDLQAFVYSFNQIAQNYVDTFNALNLPIYTDPLISGPFLDWIGSGPIYGIPRPALTALQALTFGPFNTYAYNGGIAYNQLDLVYPGGYVATSDDIYKRILTWAFFKGDGKIINIRWIKRRIIRFLFGAGGTNFNPAETYQVSITFGVGNIVSIRLLTGLRTVIGGSIYNEHNFCYNAPAIPYNGLVTTWQAYAPIALAQMLKEAIDAGILELPFQYDYTVTV